MKSILLNRDFVLLWLTQVLTQLGSNLLSFVLALRVFELTNSNTAVGILMLMFGLPTFLFGTTAGVLSDKFNKLNILLFVEISLALLVFLFFFVSETVVYIYLLVFFISLSLQFFFPSVASLIPQFVDSDHLLPANSLFTSSFYISVILGYVGAGPFLRIFGNRGILIFIPSFFILSSFLIRKLGFGNHPSVTKVAAAIRMMNPFLERGIFIEVVSGVRDTLSLVLRSPRIKNSLFILVFSQVVITTLLSLSPGFAATVLRIDVASSSLFVILPAAIGMFLGAVFLGIFAKKWRRIVLVKIGLLSIFLVLLVLSLVRSVHYNPLIYVFTVIFLFGVSNSFLEIPSNTTLQEEAKEFRGRVYGLLGSLVYGASSIPLLAFGLVADKFGVSVCLLVVSLITLAVFSSAYVKIIDF